jgi:dihydropteroate synthase
VLELPRQPLLVGILNVTPDSFSDGGKYLDPSAAVDQALALAAAGAALVDVGGESTRPFAPPVDEREELARLRPIIARFSGRLPIPWSIDTSKAAVAQAALDAGAEVINDVTALAGDPRMLDLALRSGAGVCAMHMQGDPRTMQLDPQYDDVVVDVARFLHDRRAWLVAAGVAPERIVLDPGIGFGKTHQHNLTLLAACHRLHELGCPLLVGHSRKGFIAKVLGDADADRTAGTIGVAVSLASQGVQLLRVHDVGPVCQALTLWASTGGLDGMPLRLEV